MKRLFLLIGLFVLGFWFSATKASAASAVCGDIRSDQSACPASCPGVKYNATLYCCGYLTQNGTVCSAAQCTPDFESDNQSKVPPTRQCGCLGGWTSVAGGWCCGTGTTSCPGPTTGGGTTIQAPSAGDLGALNLTIFGGLSRQFVAFQTPRGIISFILPFLFTLAGLILFVMIIWGGFEMLTGAADPKSQQAGQQRITAGIIGFLIIFAAYWIAQLLQTIFGISILG